MSSRLCTPAWCAPVLAAVALAGCGPPPPQAPQAQAKKLDESTGGISTACGLSYQVSVFPPPSRKDVAVLEATAVSDAQKLASVYKRNPEWIYQGDKVHTLVVDSLTLLRQCGLSQAAATLSRATGVH